MVYVFLPFLSAALYGLSYVLIDKLLKSIPVPTFMLCSMAVSSIFMLIVFGIAGLVKPDILSLEFIQDKKLSLYFVGTALIGILGWLTTLFALQHTSASYVAFAEISYPVFTLLFLWMLFQERNFSWQLLLGGGLILAGSAVLVVSQMSKT